MAKKATVKIPGKKGGKGTITIPGTKIKAPRELVILAGGGILAALFFMRGSEGEEEREGGRTAGMLAEEIAQRFAREREFMKGAIEDINQQLEDLRIRRLEEKVPVSPTPGGNGDDRDDRAPSSNGTFEQPTTTTYPFLNLSDVETPLEDVSFGLSDAQIRADLRRGAAYAARAEAWADRGVGAKPKYQERSVADLISIARKPVKRPGISAAQQRADIRRGSAYAKRQAAAQRTIESKPEPEFHPMQFRAGGSLAAEARARAAAARDEADERFLENPPSWY